jgi:hypothetical protein
MRDDDWLNQVMEIDHPVRVNEDGTVTGRGIQVYAPESNVETTYDGSVLKEHEDRWTESVRSQGWESARGWSGQDRYAGPFMHPSEYIGGSLAEYILATPGVWVAVVVECLRGDPDPDSMACVYCGALLNESDTGLYEDPEAGGPSSDAARHCDEAAEHLHAPEFDGDENDEPAGWAVLHMDDTAETESYVVTFATGEITRRDVPPDRTRMTLAGARNLVRLALIPTARIVRATDLAVMPNEAPAWFSAGTDEPGDKQRDLNVPIADPARAGYWGLTGPGYPDGYDWSVIDGETSETVASGHRDGEDEAMAAVDAWELRHPATLTI